MAKPLLVLLIDEDTNVSDLALSALVNFCARLDLQTSYFENGASRILNKMFEEATSFKKQLDILSVLSLMSIGNPSLLNDANYAEFFLTRVNRSNYKLKVETKFTVEDLNYIEEMARLSKLTCIAFNSAQEHYGLKNQIRLLSKLFYKYPLSSCRNSEQSSS